MKKKTIKKISLLTATILGISVALAGCGSVAENTAENEIVEEKATQEDNANEDSDVVTIHFADQKLYINPIFSYALHTGTLDKYFEGKNVTFEVSDFEGGPAVNEAIGAGQIDFGVMGNMPGVTGAASGYGSEIIAVAGNSSLNSLGVVVPVDSDISSIAELKGKTVALGIGSGAHYMFGLILNLGGITFDDVNLINAGTDAEITSIRNGEIDAAVLGIGAAQTLVDEASGKIIDFGEADPIVGNVLIASKEFVEAYPEYTEAVLQALKETFTIIDEDQDTFWAWYEDEIGTDVSSFKASFNSFTRFVEPVDGKYKEQLQNLLQFLGDNDLVDASAINFDDIYDNTYVTNAFAN